MIQKEKKSQVIADYATHEGDTGSPEVQIAILTARINELTEHHQKAATAVVVVLVHAQMLGQLVDTGSEDRDLNLRRASVRGVGTVCFDYCSLFILADHCGIPPFQK